MKYTALALTLTRRCSAACSMCCFESSPAATESLDVDLMKTFIDSAKDDQDISVISFTGGEPFLDYDLLCEMVRYVGSIGKRSTCITNCFWAYSEEIVEQRLMELKSLGLIRLNVSYDKWHRDYIPADNIKRVLFVSGKLGIPVMIGMVCTKGEKVGALVDALGEQSMNVTFQTVPCLPAGAAKKNFSYHDYVRRPVVGSLPCAYDGSIAVLYDGSIFPCCSQMVIESALSIGNYEKINYQEALRRIKNNGILYLLRNRGVGYFVKEAQNLGIDVPQEVVNPCELCALFFSKENLHLFLPFVKKSVGALISKPNQYTCRSN